MVGYVQYALVARCVVFSFVCNLDTIAMVAPCGGRSIDTVVCPCAVYELLRDDGKLLSLALYSSRLVAS